MSDRHPPPDREQPRLPRKVALAYLEAFHRIVKIGTYYPEGHVALDRAAHLFQHSLQSVAEARKSAVVDIRGRSFTLEDQEIPATTPALTELATLFDDLGIGRVEIDRAVPLKDVLQLVRTLLLQRAQLQGAKEFTKVRIADLPQSIRIVSREFLVDEAAIVVERGSDDGQNLDTVFQALEKQGLNRRQIAQCRKLLDLLAQRFTAQPIRTKGLPAVGWSDVGKILARVASGALQTGEGGGRAVSHNDLEALSTIFNGLQEEVDDQESRDTINLLVSVFNRGHLVKKPNATAEGAARKGLRPGDMGTDMTIADIHAFVREHGMAGGTAVTVAQLDRCDELAIVVQLLRLCSDDEAVGDVRRSLRDLLATSLPPRMVDVLIKGVLDLAEPPGVPHLQQTIADIVEQLRSSETFSSLPFLVMLCRRLPIVAIARLWATIINEMLLVGRSAEQRQLFAELARLVAAVPVATVREELLRLEEMAAVKGRRIATDIFDSEVKEAYPVYATLLRTSTKTAIAARLLQGLGATSPDWFIAALAPLLDPSRQEHLQLLHAYLQAAPREQFPTPLRILAGQVVVERLPQVDEAARTEPWLVATIEATRELQVEGTRELLERIVSEKKMVVVPRWPAACRQAAAQTLPRLKRKPLG